MPNNILQHVLTQFGKPTPIQAQVIIKKIIHC